MKHPLNNPLFYAIPAILLFAGGVKKKKTTLPEYRHLTEAVYASGNLYPAREYKLYANTDGTLLEQLVSEGDTIEGGQALFRIDAEMDQSRFAAAQAAYDLARLNASAESPVLKELERQLDNARRKMENDSANFGRNQVLYKKEAISLRTLEQSELLYRVSCNDYQAARKRQERTRFQVKAEEEQALSNLVIAGKGLSEHAPSSLIKGRVYEIYKEPGEQVRRGELLALLGSDSDLIIRLQVDELDIRKVKINMPVKVILDIQADKVYSARITKIYPKLNRLDQSFRVEAEFTGEKPSGLYGLTLEANIILQEKEKALTIPRNLLEAGDSLWIRKNGENVKVKIQKGAEDWDFVEVLNGIDASTELIVR